MVSDDTSFVPPGATPIDPPFAAEQAAPSPVQQPEQGRRPPRILQDQSPPEQPVAPGVAAAPQAPSRRVSLADRIALAARGDPAPPRTDAPAERAEVVRPPVSERRQSQGTTALRPPAVNNPAGEPQPTRRPQTRWDPPPEPEGQPSIDASRFAPALNDPFRPTGNDTPSEPDALAEEFPFPTGEGEEEYYDETLGDDAFDAVPGYGDEEELLGYSDDDLAAIEPPRSRRGPLAVAALVAIAIIGGVVVIMLRSGGSGDPEIITADASPTKIAPEDAGVSEGDGQAKQIYDRIDPQSEVADSRLVVQDEQPVADIPPIPEDTSGNSVSRVILEGGPAVDPLPSEVDQSPTGNLPSGGDTTDGGTTIASSSPDAAPIGPKKVRTVVVRPDGTIVSSEAVAEGEEAAAPSSESAPQTQETGSALAELPPPSETPPAPAADENPLLSDNFATEVIENPASQNPASTSVPDIPTPAPAAAPTPVVRPPAPAPNPTVVATPGSSTGPIDVTPAAPVPQQASSGLGGGFLVQVSSQRSREVALATFSELQQRYPSILGDRAPDIQRADLGERGVYYRVRVGYPTRQEAVRMCENLKAAGGDCLLATR